MQIECAPPGMPCCVCFGEGDPGQGGTHKEVAEGGTENGLILLACCKLAAHKNCIKNHWKQQ